MDKPHGDTPRSTPRSYPRSAEAIEYRKLYDTTAWRRLSAWQLRREPLCRNCDRQGRTTAATIADHEEPHKGNRALFFDASNLQSLCDTCHSAWKQQLERSGISRGCDVDGNPIDAAHHWQTTGRGGKSS